MLSANYYYDVIAIMPPVNRLLRIILILADQIIRFEIYNPNSEVNR